MCRVNIGNLRVTVGHCRLRLQLIKSILKISCSSKSSTASTYSSLIACRSASLVSTYNELELVVLFCCVGKILILTLLSKSSSIISRFSLSMAIRRAERPRGSQQFMSRTPLSLLLSSILSEKKSETFELFMENCLHYIYSTKREYFKLQC